MAPTPTTDWPRHSRWTWIIAVLLALGLAIAWIAGYGPDGSAACCAAGDTTPQAAIPPPPSVATDKPKGKFALVLDGDKRVVEGSVPDQATKDRVLQAARAAYGEANVVDKLAIDASVSASPCLDKADTLFAALKSDPPIAVACDAQVVTLTGTAGSDADKAARESWARAFFGADLQVADAIEIATPPQPVTRPEDVHCGTRIPAAVTFATGSSRIDARGRKLLDAIAPCLKSGQYEIGGHTDSIGTADENLHLSKARAEAVRAYMILKGVDAERMIASGYGADRPIGDNATRDGRAKNRRIEFVQK